MKRFLISVTTVAILSFALVITACGDTSSSKTKTASYESSSTGTSSAESSTTETETGNLFEESQPVARPYTPIEFTPEDLEVISRTNLDPHKTVTEYAGYAYVDPSFYTYVSEDDFYTDEYIFDMNGFLEANGCEKYFLSEDGYSETPIENNSLDDPYDIDYLVTCWYGGRWRVVIPLGAYGLIDCGVCDKKDYIALSWLWTLPYEGSKYHWTENDTFVKFVGYDENYVYTKAVIHLFAETIKAIKSNPENIFAYYYIGSYDELPVAVEIDPRHFN